MVYFPSYPLGTAAFIYYVCRATGVDAGMFLAVQAALCWMALMPLFDYIKKNRVVAGSFAFVMIVFLFALNRHRYSLQVDALMGYMTAGATGIALQNPKDRLRAAMALLPIAMAFVFIKSSGIIMALLILGLSARRLHGEHKKDCFRYLAASAGIVLLAMLGWQVYMRHAYAGVTIGKHTISVDNYKTHLASKNLRFIAQIALKMLKSLVRPEAHLLILPMLVLAFITVIVGKSDREKWMGQFKRLLAYSAILFVAWQAMLFLMYVFTMNNREASVLASFERYQSTTVFYILALISMFIISRISQMRALSRREMVWIATGIVAAAIVCALLPVQGSSFGKKLFDKNQGGQNSYAYILNLRERYPEIEEGKRYIVLARHDTEGDNGITTVHNVTKYEFFSNDIMIVFKEPESDDESAALQAVRKYNIYDKDVEPVTDLAGYLDAIVADYDYILVYDRDEQFEAAMDVIRQNHQDDIQVCYSYA